MAAPQKRGVRSVAKGTIANNNQSTVTQNLLSNHDKNERDKSSFSTDSSQKNKMSSATTSQFDRSPCDDTAAFRIGSTSVHNSTAARRNVPPDEPEEELPPPEPPPDEAIPELIDDDTSTAARRNVPPDEPEEELPPPEPPPDEVLEQDKAWGNNFDKKEPNTTRICFQNVGSFPNNKMDSRNPKYLSFLNSAKIDVLGIAEVNICWKNVKQEDRLRQRTAGLFECHHSSVAYNTTEDPRVVKQPGGVMIWTINAVGHRVQGSGCDPTNLGRWTWTTLRGHSGMKLRIITVYRPCIGTGTTTVYQQHKSYFNKNDDDRCPRKALTEDLCEALVKWMSKGDQIVVLADANEDVRTGNFATQLSRIGLVETNIHKHGNDAPATFKTGSRPIDGIWVTISLLDQRCGYLAIDKGVPNDGHRLLWLDLPNTLIFGQSIQGPVRPPARRLKTKLPKVADAYRTRFEQHLRQHKLPERAFALQERLTSPITTADAAEYEALDKLRVEGMRHAESKCRKLKMGATPWSPDYQRAKDIMELWQLIGKKRGGKRISNVMIRRKAKKAGIPEAINASNEEALSAYKEARQTFNETKRSAPAGRHSFLVQLSRDTAEKNGTTPKQELRNLQHRERQRTLAKKVRISNGKSRSGSVTMVVAPNQQGEWVECVTRPTIERGCLEENKARFNQAKQTPPCQPPLFEELGPMGFGPAVQAILDGTYVAPPDTDPYAVKLLQHFAPPYKPKPIPLHITTEEHIAGWKKAKEATSSGLSGIHFGHFIAGTESRLIADFEATMANVPYCTGYSPTRWQNGIECMLEKKKGNFRVDKLRTILLFEADANQNNKLIGRKAMQNAEKYGLLAPEQYGSRKNLSAIYHCLNKQLTFDILRQKRQTGALCANDAKSCYDRIVHNIASISLQAVGVQEAPIRMMFATIQKLDHYVRTAFGISKESFSGKLWAVPIQGVGQGNGAGPAIWALVSTPILRMMRAEGHGVVFKVAISGDEVRFVGYSFVDDTDLAHSARSPTETAQEVTEALQASVDTWEGGIKVSGGALVPIKSWWTLVDFVWKDGMWRYATTNERPGSITVLDADGNRQTLKRLNVDEARRTLGVRLAPDGNFQAEFLYLRSEARSWGDRVRAGHLDRQVAWESMTTTIYSTLKYPLPVTTFTREQCKEILKPVLLTGLPASGICRNIKRAVVHGPLEYQGLGLTDLYTLQGLAHIQFLLRFGDTKTIEGQLMRTSLEQLRLELGVPGPIFCADYETLNVLATHSWVTHTWQFLHEEKIQVTDNTAEVSLQREKDRYLIPSFTRAGIKGNKLAAVNRCRLFLQAFSLADIVTGDGRKITYDAWNGIKSTQCRTEFDWPKQGKPDKSDWLEWRAAIQHTFNLDNRDNSLPNQLGNWTTLAPQWRWYYDHVTDRLYSKKTNEWFLHPRAQAPRSSTRAGATTFLIQANPEQTPPPGLWRCTVSQVGVKVTPTGAAKVQLPTATTPPQRLVEAIRKLPKELKWAAGRYNDPHLNNSVLIAEAIRDGSSIAVSDGSFKQARGTASFVIEAKNSKGRLRGDNIVAGQPGDQSAYRSELSGLLGIVVTVCEICKVHRIVEGRITVACDGEEALLRAFDPDRYTTTKSQNFDLILGIRKLTSESPIKWSFRHVYGHQDDDPYAVLDRWATLNTEMDTAAKEYWQDTADMPPERDQSTAIACWELRINGNVICRNLDYTIKSHCTSKNSVEYWVQKKKAGSLTPQDIDSEALGDAMRSVPKGRQTWIVKQGAGENAVGTVMKRRKERDVADCPRCAEEEDTAHVMSCKDPAAIDRWRIAVEKMRVDMAKSKTPLAVTTAICSALLAWKTGSAMPTTRLRQQGLEQAMNDQREIGWSNFIEGRVSSKWRYVMDQHYKRVKSRKNGRRWTSEMIQKLWNVAWDQWEHRNGILHDKDREKEHHLLTQRTDRLIAELYQEAQSIPPQRQPFQFNESLESIRAKEFTDRRMWLEHATNALGRHYRKAERETGQQRRFMQAWRAG